MTAKKKFNFKAPLEVFAKSIVQPMMYLSVAGILLIVGIILTNKNLLPTLHMCAYFLSVLTIF